MVALALLLVAGKANGDTSGQDLYVDSSDPGQGSSVPGQTVVYAGPNYAVVGSNTFDNGYVGYNGTRAITQADGTLTINRSLYFGFHTERRRPDHQRQ